MIDCDCVELFCWIPEATDVSAVTLKADGSLLADLIVFNLSDLLADLRVLAEFNANNSKPTGPNKHLKLIWTFIKEPLRFLTLDLSNLQTYKPPQQFLQNQDRSIRVIHSRVWITTGFAVFSFFVLLWQMALLFSICADEEQRNRSGCIAYLVVLVLIRRVL